MQEPWAEQQEMKHINNILTTITVKGYPGQSALCPPCAVCYWSKENGVSQAGGPPHIPKHTTLGYTQPVLKPFMWSGGQWLLIVSLRKMLDPQL